MTILRPGAGAPRLRTRTDAEVLVGQLRAIEAWTREHPAAHLLPVESLSREERLDLVRRRDVVERERQALVDRTMHQLRHADAALRSSAGLRAVVAHRSEWFKTRLTDELEAAGVVVVADLENGADAVGVTVAEQPDVLVLEGHLPMLTGLDVTRAVRAYAPDTVVVAQVEGDLEIGPFLEAGATTAFTRRVPPGEIAAEVRAMLPA